MDWNETFKDYKKCKFDDIAAYVEKEAPAYKTTLAKQIKAETDFLTIKKAFYEKFFKDLIPIAKIKPNKMAKWLEANK